ncbi:MAG: radical SAM protein [Deltaproteobacteria bacterium]|nr:radical SAM protein [Deltaproteobacteria bacterium]
MNEIAPQSFFYEMGPIRPPSEGQDHSLLLRTTRNCPWNRCQFCSTYQGHKFSFRKVPEIKGDLEVVKAIYDKLLDAAQNSGLGGRVTQDALRRVWAINPELYGENAGNNTLKWQNLTNVANWINSGARTVFLQDADALVMRTPDLVAVLNYLKEVFPTVERVTAYARSKSCARKSMEELAQIRAAGLVRLHVGLESGCDEVLAWMKKGVTAREHVEGGKKAVAAGFSLSEYVMPGLGGKALSRKHALDSAQVLNEINPDFIRLRSLALRRGSPLLDRWEKGEFDELPEDQVVEEIGWFVENLQCNAYLASDQMSNLLWEVEGRLPQDKEKMLSLIRDYLTKPLGERLTFRRHRRRRSFLAVYGILGPELEELVQAAEEAIRQDRADAAARTDAAIAALKKGFV